MNSKRAKRIRRFLRAWAAESPDHVRPYELVRMVPKALIEGKTEEEKADIARRYPIVVRPGCLRSYYKRLKKYGQLPAVD